MKKFTAILVKNSDSSFFSTRQAISENELNEIVAYWKNDGYYRGLAHIIILNDGMVVEQVAL